MLRRVLFGLIMVAFVAAPAVADVYFFEDRTAFRDFMQQPGEDKFLKGIENFEEAVFDPNSMKVPLNDNLRPGVPNPGGPTGFPNGLAEPNLIVQTNITPQPNPPAPNKHGGPAALFVVDAGFKGSNSKKVGEDLFLQGIVASLDLIFTEPNHTGVGFDLSRFGGWSDAGWHITIYDKADNVIGKHKIVGPVPVEPAKNFFGVWSDVTIGRINIWDQSELPDGTPIAEPDAIDNIEMWVPEPGTLSLLALGGLALLRRRRS